MEQKEDIVKPKDFYEAGEVIGEEEQKSDNPLGSCQYNETFRRNIKTWLPMKKRFN